MDINEAHKQALGYTKITVDATTAEGLAQGTLGAIPSGATMALIIPEAAIRFRDDGVDPTASAGMPLVANQPLPYTGTLSTLKLISQSGSADVSVAFYKG